MKKKKRWPIVLVLFLWFIFLSVVAGVAYLSFQNGVDSQNLGKNLIENLAKAQYQQEEVTENELLEFTYMIRQNGRILAFLLVGITGTITMHVTFINCNYFFRTALTAGILLSIAYLTEKLKIYIPTRHYSYEEMMISFASVIAGFLFVSIMILTARAVKGLFRLMAAAHGS